MALYLDYTGLSYYDNKVKVWVTDRIKNLTGFTAKAVDALPETGEDKYGNLWVATYGGGVNVIKRGKDGRILFLNRNNVMTRYPNDAFLKVRTVTLDKYGKIWAGSTDGILVMSYFNNKVKIQVVGDNEDEEDKKNRLPGNV